MEEQSEAKFDEGLIIEVKVVKLKWKDAVPQILATIIAQLVFLQGGVHLTYSTILIPQLRNSTTDIVIDDEQASWIAGTMTLFLPVGSLAIGPLSDRFGPKLVCVLSNVPFIFAWVLFAFSTEVYHLYIARGLTGFGTGLSNVVMIYISEISHPSFRPMLLGFISVSVSFGILLTCILGLWCNWRTMAIFFSIFTIIGSIAMAAMPESPYWLNTFLQDIPRNRLVKSLRWIYKNTEIYEQELQVILKRKDKPSTEENHNEIILNRIIQNLTIFTDPTVYKPTIILFILLMLQQLSGASVTIIYAVDIFTKLGGTFANGIDEYVALVFLGIVRLVVSIASSAISKKLGRRVLMNTSCLGMFLSCFVLSLGKLCLKSVPSDTVALISVLSFVSFASLGFLLIPWSLVAELLPVRVKSKVGAILITSATMMLFIVVKTFPALMRVCNIETVFLLFALDNLLAVCFVYWFLPETLGKTFTDIEKYFK